MEIKDFEDYSIASISSEDIRSITDLEKTISSKADGDIVLIAYQTKKEAKK